MADVIFFEREPVKGDTLQLAKLILPMRWAETGRNDLGEIKIIKVEDRISSDYCQVRREVAKRHSRLVTFMFNNKRYAREAYWPGSDEYV